MNDKKTGISYWYENYFGPDYLKIDIQKNTKKEVSFIRSIFKLNRGTKLLDVACGYGRHLVPLIESGIDVVGCDLSQFMLKKSATRLKENGKKKQKLILCDNRALPFRHTFDFACNMFNSFGYFEREDDNFKVLKSIAQALKPGGLFLLDLLNRDFFLHSFHQKDWFENNGAFILEKKWFDSVNNRSEIDVTVLDKHGKRMYHHSIRLYSYTELTMLLEAAGFTILSVFGGFNGEDFDWFHDRMLILSQSI
ncbi:MAG: class I SAM-dependent methyltransferase [Candidatus Latescibacteria bacterium]|jgi:SAM-dependent methyltransferase|nr:class I SAM-dependent methyltransferase [Candidatus Latescibacterota bacterium]